MEHDIITTAKLTIPSEPENYIIKNAYYYLSVLQNQKWCFEQKCNVPTALLLS